MATLFENHFTSDCGTYDFYVKLARGEIVLEKYKNHQLVEKVNLTKKAERQQRIWHPLVGKREIEEA